MLVVGRREGSRADQIKSGGKLTRLFIVLSSIVEGVWHMHVCLREKLAEEERDVVRKPLTCADS